MTDTAPIVQQKNIPVWKRTLKETILPDEVVELVVDAYLTGKKDGYKEAGTTEARILSKAFQENLERAMKISSDLYETLKKEFKIELTDLYLKIENKSNFKSALVLPLDFYYSNVRRKLTEKTIEIEIKNHTDTFDISFTTLPNKENLNLQKLFLDGFIFQYEKNQRGAKT